MAKEVRSIYITCEEVDGKDSYRIEVTRNEKKTLSQRKGWVPSYTEPEKMTATTSDALCKQLKEVLGDCKK